MILAELKEAIRSLHREKDRAYGNSWKRRGEQISIVANIARKVDRIERMACTQVATRDETDLDTSIDLLVYCLKYLAFLAERDRAVADALAISHTNQPFSNGHEAFDVMLLELDAQSGTDVASAAAAVVADFEALERTFASEGSPVSAMERHLTCIRLRDSAFALVLTLALHSDETTTAFLDRWSAR